MSRKAQDAVKKADLSYKFVLVGDSSVGKSAILTRFADNHFASHYSNTIGVDFRFRTIAFGKKTIQLQIWDTAGQEKFRTLTSSYYRNANCVVLVYDVTNERSFNHTKDWLEEVQRAVPADGRKPQYILLGNKSDLMASKCVPTEKAKKFATEHSMFFMECSAKDGTNVDTAFLTAAETLLNQDAKGQSQQGDVVNLNKKQGEKSSYYSNCC